MFNDETNQNPDSDVTSEESAAESVATETTTTGTTETADTGAESVADTTTDVAPAQEWTGSYKDVTDTQRVITVTEKDGTTVSAPFNWPGKAQAEDLVDQQVVMVNLNGRQAMQQTDGTYHLALMPHFGQALVNNKPAGMVTEAFFDSRQNKTYRYFMEQADSFLDKKLNTD